VAAFDILMLSSCGTKGPVMTAKQTPWMHPCMAHDADYADMVICRFITLQSKTNTKQVEYFFRKRLHIHLF